MPYEITKTNAISEEKYTYCYIIKIDVIAIINFSW